MPEFLQASVDYLDSDFNAEDIYKYRLSIQLRLDGFSFAILHGSSKRLLSLKDYKIIYKPSYSIAEKWENLKDHFKTFLAQSLFNFDSFEKLSILVDHKAYTLLPEALYLEKEHDQYLLFNQNIPYQFVAVTDKILSVNQVLLSLIHEGLDGVIKDQISEFNYIHSNTVLLSEIFKIHRNRNSKPSIYASVSHNNMHIIAFGDNKILMCNSFKFTSKEDFVYFILLAYDQLGFNTEQDNLFFLGDISTSSSIYKICWQYVRHINFIDHLAGIHAGAAFDQMPIHQYFTLIQSTLCE